MSTEVLRGGRTKAGSENTLVSQLACLPVSHGKVIANPLPTLITSHQLSLGDAHSAHLRVPGLFSSPLVPR